MRMLGMTGNRSLIMGGKGGAGFLGAGSGRVIGRGPQASRSRTSPSGSPISGGGMSGSSGGGGIAPSPATGMWSGGGFRGTNNTLLTY